MRFDKGEMNMILVYFIIGIMILGIGTVFIFDLYDKGDIDFETCKHSIILRSHNIEFSPGGFTLVSFKDSFPLECRTSVVEINEGNVNDAGEIIARKMTECWALFDNGDVSPFPEPRILELFSEGTSYSTCVPCSRITFTSGAKKILREKGSIDLRIGMDNQMGGGKTYYQYLNNRGRQFSAFVNSESFDLNSEFFLVESDEFFGVKTIENRINGVEATFAGGSNVNLPRLFDPEKGDLIISYGSTIFSGYAEFGNYVPYLIYFQVGQDVNIQEDPNLEPFTQAKNNFLGGTGLCEYWEGIVG